MGENPIKEKIRLKLGDSSYFLELKTDGTALDIYVDDYDKSNKEEIYTTYKYSYDSKNKTISMILEKTLYGDLFIEEDQLLTYSEICSKINEDYTVKTIREYDIKYYEERKADDWFKEDYPNCDTYEKYEAAFLKKGGFASFDAYVEAAKQEIKNYYKAMFGAKITYVYEIEGGKMTLTEKFTGVKNLASSECNIKSNHSSISASYASIEEEETDDYYNGTPNTDNKTILFESSKTGEKFNVDYVEDIDAGTVTIELKGKKYVYEFRESKFIQVE